MRILHLSCVAPPKTGGIGQVASEEVKRLRERGHDAWLFAPRLKVTPEEPDAPWVRRYPTLMRWGNASVLWGYEKEMKSADVIHLHYPFFGTAEAIAQFCLLNRKPLVTTFHMDAKAAFPLGLLFDAYRAVAQPAIFRSSRAILVSSFDYADHASAASWKKAHPEQFVELPFGVDDSFTTGQGDRARFDIPDNVKIVGFTGGMDIAHAFKGIPHLLEAFSKLDNHPHLLLVGSGNRKRIFEAQAKDLGVADRCHFVGRLPHDELVKAYQTMDVFAFPSTSGAEAFGLVAAEALSCGVPVVASDLPGVRTVVTHEETGLLIPPNDVEALRGALSRLLSNDAERKGMSERAASTARERFRWDRHIDGLVEVYRSVVRG